MWVIKDISYRLIMPLYKSQHVYDCQKHMKIHYNYQNYDEKYIGNIEIATPSTSGSFVNFDSHQMT